MEEVGDLTMRVSVPSENKLWLMKSSSLNKWEVLDRSAVGLTRGPELSDLNSDQTSMKPQEKQTKEVSFKLGF